MLFIATLVAYCHLWVTNQSLQTGQNDSVIHFEVALYLLISFWEVTAGRCVYNLINFVQITQNFVISLLLKTLKQILQLESIPWMYLHNILKRLLAKVCFDASFRCLSRFLAFRVTFRIY